MRLAEIKWATGIYNTTYMYDGGSNILRGKTDQLLNEGPIVADQPLNEGQVVADQPLNEGPIADQLSEHDTYSEIRFQTTQLPRLMMFQ